MSARLVYEFGGFRLDAGQRLLYAGFNGEPVSLTARVFDTLLHLVEHHGELVDKRALMNAVWPGVVVEENNLNQNISTLRKALGEVPGEHRFIATVPGRGYRFVAEVKTLPATAPTPAPVSARIAASSDATTTSTASAAPRASIAVVPFANLTGDPSKEYLSDGLAEELIHALCRVPGLKVPSRTSSFAYKDRKVDVRRIASDLGVEAVLEGSVRSAGERLRVTAQLVDAATGYHRWSHSYDRKFEDLFALQDELAQAIMQAVQPSLHDGASPSPAQPPTDDLEAYQLYLQGLSLRSRASEQNLLRAIELFEQASKRDPHFTRATGAALVTRISLSGWGYPGAITTVAAEREMRALALNPELADAHEALVVLSAKRGRFVEAQKHYRAATSVENPEPYLRAYYANATLSPVGHLRLSLQEHNEAFRAAPTEPRLALFLALLHMVLGNDAEALRYARLAADLGLQAHVPAVHSNASLRAKRYEEAAEQMFFFIPIVLRSQMDLATLKLAYRGLDDASHRPAALTALERLGDLTAGDSELDLILQIHVMLLYTLLGTTERAFDCAERFLGRFAEVGEIGSPGVWATLWFPEMRPFREHPRFVALAERLGLMDYWKVHGPPDNCELRDGKLIMV